jgi:DNA-binding NtrC family response regulator
LQEKQFERVGGSQTITVDVRVIASTNCDLDQALREKRFREDLYYRLNVVAIKLPPIRERGDDIDTFARHFLGVYANEMGKPVKRFSDESMAELRAHTWPGNIRELENAVERAVIMCNGEIIRPEHLMIRAAVGAARREPFDLAQDRPAAGVSGSERTGVSGFERSGNPETPGHRDPKEGLGNVPVTASLRDAELSHIRRVLQHTKWNQSAAAQVLGIDRKTLRNKIREFRLEK